MLKDYFQKYIENLNTLRSEHFKVQQYLSKGKYKMKQKFFGKGKKHYDFDLNAQQFFHEYVDDIIFQQPEIQQIFYNKVNKSLENPLQFQNKKTDQSQQEYILRKNPSEVRALLHKHFKCRETDLKYKKYLISLRLHNLPEQMTDNNETNDFLMKVFRSRTNLIDKQIQQCLSRAERLGLQDYFEESYTMGGKPVPINQNGQPIYKYLDEQQCWFSNISRDDIQVYSRAFLYSEQVLQDKYWPVYYKAKALVSTHGIQLIKQVQNYFITKYTKSKNQIVEVSKNLIALFENQLEQLSPGNLQQKQNINSFIYQILGVTTQSLVYVPLLPAIKNQLCENFTKSLSYFFKDLLPRQEKYFQYKTVISLIPKINNFCAILFRYQNQQILEGQKIIKLGLDDDIDMRKQLITMLEQLWVRKHVKINYQRFQYKVYLKKIDWKLDKYSKKMQRIIRSKTQNGYQSDPSVLELLSLFRMTSYSCFRKCLKRRSEKLIGRLQSKYKDLQLMQRSSEKTDEQMNIQRLSQLYKSKLASPEQKSSVLKQSAENFLKFILKNQIYSNPVQLQILETIKIIRIRQLRTQVLNTLNAIKCYQRNIDFDLNVIHGAQFQFQLDDDLLINSNKQLIEKFERDIKDNETVITKGSKTPSVIPTIENEDFLIRNKATKKMMYKKDIIKREYFGDDIPHYLVCDGKRKKNKIMYSVSLDDLKIVEQRIVEVSTHFINNYEKIIKMRNLSELVDRVSVLQEIFNYELQYAHEKFNLIESYYHIYENTTEPLSAHKIAKIILKIIYSQPKIDYTNKYFDDSYKLQISQLKNQTKIVELFSKIMASQERFRNKKFHQTFANMQNIPLTLWAYVYGDIEHKTKNYSKLQRMNSVSSKFSRTSREDGQKDPLIDLRNQIKEQFGQDSEGSEPDFRIQQYDEYLLRKNMDDIFEDIVADGDNQKQKEKDSGNNISALGLQNVTLNPRFEGGPHPMLHYLPEIDLTSKNKEKILNFYEYLCQIANIHYIIEDLQKEHLQMYGKCSTNYQLCLKNLICQKIYKILLEAESGKEMKIQQFHKFQSDDPYHETVIKSLKNYEQVMTSVLDPPSSIQFSLPSTHERHQTLLPNYITLQYFDLYSLGSLIKLKKPINIAQYRELNLGINFIQFLRLRQKLYHLTLERENAVIAYQQIGKICDIPIEKYVHCYTRVGSTQVFLSSSEIRLYESNFLKYPVYNQSIDELRLYYEIQKSDLKLLKSQIAYNKYLLEPAVQILNSLSNPYLCQLENSSPIIKNLNTQITIQDDLNVSKILLAYDAKTIKMMKNRVVTFLSVKASENLKIYSFVKYKQKVKNIFETKYKRIKENTDIQQIVNKQCLDGNANEKYNKNCVNILEQKVKKILIFEEAKLFKYDIQVNNNNMQTFINLHKSINKIKMYTVTLPYLQQYIYVPTEYQQLYKKIFYDQKKPKKINQIQGSQSILFQKDKNRKIYINNKEQLLQDWFEFNQINKCPNMEQILSPQSLIKQRHPPSNKDVLFKWLFKIPSLTSSSGNSQFTDLEKQSNRHFLKMSEPFTGKVTQTQYRNNQSSISNTIIKGSNNKYSALLEKYYSILQYIEASLFIASLHLQDDVYQSLFNNISLGCRFEERYPAIDQTIDQEQFINNNQFNDLNDAKNTLLAPCYIYENKKAELEKKLKIKISSRGYSDSKRHWAVLDEILDFIITKVQGYGVIRQAIMPVKLELELLLSGAKTTGLEEQQKKITDFLTTKTSNLYKAVYLSIWQAYLLPSSQKDQQEDQQLQQYVLPLVDNIILLEEPIQELQSAYSSNIRRGIQKQICLNSQNGIRQKIKLYDGVKNQTSCGLISHLKTLYCFLPVNLDKTVRMFLEDSTKNEGNCLPLGHNWENIDTLQTVFRKLSYDNRARIFANIRYYYNKADEYLKSRVKNDSSKTAQQQQQSKNSAQSNASFLKKMLEKQELKSLYFTHHISTKINMIGLTYFKIISQDQATQSLAIHNNNSNNTLQSMSPLFNWQLVNKLWNYNKELVDFNTYNVYEQLEAYKESGKIQFNKRELHLLGKNQGGSQQQYNKMIREIIFNKLLNEQFKSEILLIAIKRLKSEKFPKEELKKIQNQSLIPRVHLVSSYSSPLAISRQTYISQQYKLAFVQAFINRFRNKVSRVDLLSSGYGFVITVPDLEDCVNYMNKLLFTFTEKQFRARMDTFLQYYEIMIEGIRNRNKIIEQQRQIIKYLQSKADNIMETEYLSKVSKLLEEKTLIEERLDVSDQVNNGIEHRVRKTVQIEYSERVSKLEKQNQQLRNKFEEFKDLLVKLFKDSTKNNFLEVLNIFRSQVTATLDKKIDLSLSFQKTTSSTNSKAKQQKKKQYNKVKENQEGVKRAIKVQQQEQQNQEQRQYDQSDIQKCKIGQSIIHDPYYTTKLINKMRLFNAFKLGSKLLKQQSFNTRQNSELTQLHKIQDKYIVQSQREKVMQEELIRAHEELSKKNLEIQKIKWSNEQLENQKAKMKILSNGKDRKIQLSVRQLQEAKKKLLEYQEDKNNNIQKAHQQSIVSDKLGEELPKITALRQKKKSTRKVDKSFLTNLEADHYGQSPSSNSNNISLYQKFELSNKDSTWRQKCEQLYLENKRILNELEKLRESNPTSVNQHRQQRDHRESHSLNLRNKRTADISANQNRTQRKKFPNLSFKYNSMKN